MVPDVDKLITQALEKSEVLFSEERTREAEIVLNQLLKVDPNNVKALQLLGLVHHRGFNYKDAIIYFKKALELEPNNSENHNNISLCYSCLREKDLALEHINKAIELKPDHAAYYSNLGLQYRGNGDTDNAIKMFNKAIEMNNSANFWSNLGNTYGGMNKIDDAIKCFKEAIKINPNLPEIHVDLAYGYHLNGQWKEAWEEYEYRLLHFPQMRIFTNVYDTSKRWTKPCKDLQDKKIVVYCEQGNGDFIQFARYLPELKKTGCKILLHTPKELISLFKYNNLADQYEEKFKNEDCDLHCSVMSLPYLLNIDVMNYVWKPYLEPSKTAEFNDYKDFFKIGIVWAGNPRHPNDINRSCRLSLFKEINSMPNVKLFSLQKDVRKRAYSYNANPVDLTNGCDDMRLVDMTEFMNDYDDTAAIIKGLDFIIAVDTSIIHIAGAMNKPTFVLMAYNPDWRWGISGEKTFWYPSLRLIRQQSPGDWDSVFKKINVLLQDI